MVIISQGINVSESIFDQIRGACREVALIAENVKIDYEKVEQYSRHLPLKHALDICMDKTNHYCEDEIATITFFIVLDSINFGSGYFNFLRKEQGKSGYFTIASKLREEFVRCSLLSADDMKNLSVNDCFCIFGQTPCNWQIKELMSLFAKSLNQLGEFVESNYEGSFENMLKSACNSAEKLVNILLKMDMYQDVAYYKTIRVPFLKRAQITVSDLYAAFNGKGYGYFDDIDRLTIFADNLVPHVLRKDGILVYSEQLAKKIDSEQPILAGSEEEIEIRACALQAAELIVDVLKDRSVNARGIDQVLWHRGHQPFYRQSPRHITMTTNY